MSSVPKSYLKKWLSTLILGAGIAIISLPVSALNIVLSNDDGLTSNIKALYTALIAEGHDVIVSTPCQGQSGQGTAIALFTPITSLTENCLNNAGEAGGPGAGPVTKSGGGFDFSDFYYVNSFPIMATAYGLDVLAQGRWGANPDLVISGPNEGQNLGRLVLSSGTVSNSQFVNNRSIPAIAVSAGANTAGDEDIDGNFSDNPLSATIAELTIDLVNELIAKADGNALLPQGVALNVNFNDEVNSETPWAFSRIGNFNTFQTLFVEDLSQDPVAQAFGLGGFELPALSVTFLSDSPTDDQLDNEALVSQNATSVTAMQFAYEHRPSGQQWLRLRLRDLFDN